MPYTNTTVLPADAASAATLFTTWLARNVILIVVLGNDVVAQTTAAAADSDSPPLTDPDSPTHILWAQVPGAIAGVVPTVYMGNGRAPDLANDVFFAVSPTGQIAFNYARTQGTPNVLDIMAAWNAA